MYITVKGTLSKNKIYYYYHYCYYYYYYYCYLYLVSLRMVTTGFSSILVAGSCSTIPLSLLASLEPSRPAVESVSDILIKKRKKQEDNY